METKDLQQKIKQSLEEVVAFTDTIANVEDTPQHIEIDIAREKIRHLYEQLVQLKKVAMTAHATTEAIVLETASVPQPDQQPAEPAPSQSEEVLPIFELKDQPAEVPPQAPLEENIGHQPNPIQTPEIDLFSLPTPAPEKIQSINEKIAREQTDKSIASKMQKNAIQSLKAAIGINEKFLFINCLFEGDMQKYNESVELIDSFEAEEKASRLLEALQTKYNWNPGDHASIQFKELVERRFQ